MVDWTIRELDEAARLGAEMSKDALARVVRYDRESRTITVDLQSGASFSFPVDKVQGLAGASDQNLSEVEIFGGGYALHWETLDVDFSVAGLAAGIFGTAKYMAAQAGRQKSDAKAAAARTNGSRGGRPRKAG